MGAHFTYTWSPDEMALRAKLAGLAHAATRLGVDIGAASRMRRKERYEEQARANFAAAYAAKRAKNPKFSMSEREQEREIERMRQALVRLHMTELAHRPRSPRGTKNEAKAAKTSATAASPKAIQQPAILTRLTANLPQKDRLAVGSYETAATSTPARSKRVKTGHTSDRESTPTD